MIDIREKLSETHEGLVFMDGPEFDAAILGVAERAGSGAVVAYDTQEVLRVLEQDMSADEAREYFDFNIGCAYVGEKTPVYIDTSF